jgi:hypothetical protein
MISRDFFSVANNLGDSVAFNSESDSGDQFCVYVADRFVLPSLTQEEITAIASGRHQMDAFVRRYIHETLSYRFVILSNGKDALALETAIKSGEWEPGRPLLNPGK